jgi:DNA-binding NtrC family response regulator
LILGETGSGKGVLARWLHENGPRREQAYVDLNCAGLAPQLVESDLFGHEKGAFTGAHTLKSGLLDVAHRGTLFLDEIGDLDHTVQPKLLKVLEEHTYRRVGGVTLREVDVRLIAATHKDLAEMAAVGKFRNDLLFRINTITFELPSLRERTEDLPLLTDAILASLWAEGGRRPSPPILTESARQCLAAHPWTGNLRELRNVLERALLFSRDDRIDDVCLQLAGPRPPQNDQPFGGTLLDAEVLAIKTALSQCEGRVAEAAKALGIPRSSLYVKIKKYGLKAS